MKKAFLKRLVAITFFCFSFLAIKSESSFNSAICDSISDNGIDDYKTVLSEDAKNQHYKYDAFFIRI